MKVVLSLLMFSATLFLSSAVLASDLSISPTYCIKEPSPGLYLWLKDDGSLTARLSFSSENKVKDVNGRKADGTDRFSFFLSPEFGTKQNVMSANIAAGMPAEDTGSRQRQCSDYGIHCGFTWKFR